MVAGAAFIAIVGGRAWLVAQRLGTHARRRRALPARCSTPLLGATLQARRWCDTCERETERADARLRHGHAHAGGAAWMDNDLVNLAATMAGAFVVMAGLIVREW